MKNIYFIRHCAYENPRNIFPGRLPVKLSTQGIDQAKRLAKYFVDKKIEKIYSSEVLRCKQTSQIISDNKIPTEFDQRLLETLSAYQGYWFEKKEELDWKLFFSHHKKLGGENLLKVQKRILSFWKELVEKKETQIIICSHGDPLYCLYLFLTNKPLIDDLANTPEDFQPEGSIREIAWKNQDSFEVLPIIKP